MTVFTHPTFTSNQVLDALAAYCVDRIKDSCFFTEVDNPWTAVIRCKWVNGDETHQACVQLVFDDESNATFVINLAIQGEDGEQLQRMLQRAGWECETKNSPNG